MSNITTLNRTEAIVLQQFVSQVDFWQSTHGEHAKHIEIIYFPEDDGFEVLNGEPNNGVLKRNRTTVFRTEILAWGASQLNQLKNWSGDKQVTAFTCIYKDGEFGVAVEVSDTAAQANIDIQSGEAV